MSPAPDLPEGSGLELAEAYAREVVGPLLDAALPGVAVGLARLGSGSDVLGLDDAVSRDHDWGLRLTVLVPDGRLESVDALLEERLPAAFRGHPTRFATTWDPRVHQRAEVVTALGIARSRTGLDLSRPPGAIEWLSLTGQAVLELVAGPVFRDDGEIGRMRATLARYPADIRLFAVASGWQRIEQELPFVRRTAARGDDTGSRAIAARLATTAMRIGFLLEERWAPYSKWLGSAFALLPRTGGLAPLLHEAIAADTGAHREAALVAALRSSPPCRARSGCPPYGL